VNATGLGNVVVVLDEPQNLVNVAGVVRAMKNMGLRRLRLVRPVEFDPWRIEGIAHRSEDVVESAALLDTLDEAVADCLLVIGTSARARTAQRNYGHPREWAPKIAEKAREGPVAIVFGREDRGLSNEALDRCDGVILIPTDPEYRSLNLAQACLLIAYEVFLAFEGDERPLPQGKRSVGPATRGEMEAMLGALEGGLRRIEFFKARPADGVMRIFRTLLARAELDRHEAGLVKALGFEIEKFLDRQGVPPPDSGQEN
jgi:tRNA/rRNA methyltransferase/tRNA (cytidine32/uridine32-2'-O)-methyltransferase